METIYYSIDAKRLSVCASAEGRRACGGQETVCYTFVPSRKRTPPKAGAGKVLDFEAYRRAHRPECPEEPAEEENPARMRPGRHGQTEHRWKLLDLCASGTVVAASLVVLVRFLPL